jgi:arylsulfatase A-like enzyme
MRHLPLLSLFTFLIAAPTLAAAPATASPPRPNIIVIVADDLGWNDVGYHGSKIKTPNLDRIAKEGVRLEQHYVAPVCSPTRSALMSGRYWSRFGVISPTNDQCLPFGTTTLASALKSKGYETAITGKWHLGSLPAQGPNHFGFDHSYGSLAGGCGPFNHRYKQGPYTHTWHRNEKLIEEPGHITDLIAGEAIQFIEKKRGGDARFFLYVPFTAPHLPIKEPKEWEEFNSHLADPAMRLYAACVSHMDDGVGRILEAVRRAGHAEDTLVVFSSDNGGSTDVQNNDTKYPEDGYANVRLPASNSPLRGKKAQVYEGGIRVPALAYWPGRLQPAAVNAPIHIVDWMPTLCGLAGYTPEKDLKWDGHNVWSVVSGVEKAPPPRTLYWVGPGKNVAFRDGDMKLIVNQGKSPELYDLAADPYEKTDLAAAQPDRVKQLRASLAKVAERDRDALAGKEPKPVE